MIECILGGAHAGVNNVRAAVLIIIHYDIETLKFIVGVHGSQTNLCIHVPFQHINICTDAATSYHSVLAVDRVTLSWESLERDP